MGIFEPVQVAFVEGYWRGEGKGNGRPAEDTTHHPAETLAEERESGGGGGSAFRIRAAVNNDRSIVRRIVAVFEEAHQGVSEGGNRESSSRSAGWRETRRLWRAGHFTAHGCA